MSKKKKMRFYKLPGSQRQRRRAKNLLECELITENAFRVWGGEKTHYVTRTGILKYTCDCDRFSKESLICSHIIRVMMNNGTYPSRKLEQIF